LIIIHEFGHFAVAKRNGVKVERFAVGFGPKIAGIKKGETEYALCAVPLGGYVKMAGETYDDKPEDKPWEFLSKSPGVRARIILAGPFLNYLGAFVLFSLIFMVGNPELSSKIGEVMEGYPAESAGLLSEDRIVSVNGKEVGLWAELTEIIHKNTEGPVLLGIERSGQLREISVVPKVETRKDVFGVESKIALVGIAPSQDIVVTRYNPFKAVYMGAKRLFLLSFMTLKAIFFMITGRMSLKAVSGPVGIFVLTGKAAELGFIYLLQMMAVLSASLAIFNVLPIPVLDGGHLVFILIEKIRGRKVSPRVQEIATQTGLYILIALMLVVFYSDFMKFGFFEKVKGIFTR
jgi:regulator of sigma E protease